MFRAHEIMISFHSSISRTQSNVLDSFCRTNRANQYRKFHISFALYIVYPPHQFNQIDPQKDFSTDADVIIRAHRIVATTIPKTIEWPTFSKQVYSTYLFSYIWQILIHIMVYCCFFCCRNYFPFVWNIQ